MTTSNEIPESGLKSRESMALRISLLTAVIHLLLTATLLIFGMRIAQQMIFVAIITFVILVAAIVSIILNRRGRPDFGIWIIIATITMLVPFVSLLRKTPTGLIFTG